MTLAILENSLGWIDREILQAQPERGGLKMQLSFLDKFGERQKSLAWRGCEKRRVARGEGLEVGIILLHIRA